MPFDQPNVTIYDGYKAMPLSGYKSMKEVQAQLWADFVQTLADTPFVNVPFPCDCPQCRPFNGLRYDADTSDAERKPKAVRLLQEGAARLKLPGVWIKGGDRKTSRDVEGGYQFCARGVLVWLAVKMGFDLGTLRMALTTLASEVPTATGCSEPQTIVAAFNDDKRTTLNDVLRMFDRATAVLQTQRAPAMA